MTPRMMKQVFMTSFLVVSSAAAAPQSTPCPTCPKGYVHSSLEEVLLSKKKGKELDLKKTLLGSSQSSLNAQSRVRTTPPKTPIQIVASRTERLRKASQSTPKVDMLGSPARSKEENHRLSEENRRQMEIFAHQQLMQRYAEKRRK